MQREIKFRGKVILEHEGMANTTSKKWVYGSLIVESDRQIIQWVDNGRIHAKVVDPTTIGQYTGRKTSPNGTAIYEGDIIKNYPLNIVVKWVETTNYTGWNIGKTIHDRIIIGNIHDNPGLPHPEDMEKE